ncbi:hypothetical protein SAMN04488038_11929 [Solimonas aquatica]|uniref:HTH luxR-type domain-containing protein n=2 Tax=Solimonas aquatica TaxID=489703 RepID=A0A1H9M6I5_9GAMM|nr:hypothetical protein SAMN04488038_11929 [Solimonas aquatica]
MKKGRREALTECLREAALNDDALNELPRQIATLVGGMSCIVLHQPKDGVIENFTYNAFGPEHLPIYMTEFANEDPWTKIGLERAVNRAVSIDRYLSLAEFERTRICNEFARPHGLESRHCVGIVLPAKTGTGVIGVQRNKRQGAFGPVDEAILQSVAPELRHFFEVRSRLARAERRAKTAEALFDRFVMGVLLVDSECRVLFANEAVLALLRQGDGLSYGAGRRISASVRCITQHLHMVVRQVAYSPDAESHEEGLVVNRASGAPLQLAIAPFRYPHLGHKASVLILVQDPSAGVDGLRAILGKMFRFSAGETDVALGLAEGKTLPQIARERGVLVSTVQTQLKRALEKSGLRKQSALVAAVGRVPLLRSR